MKFENDGTITSHRDMYWEDGRVVSKVTFKAEGFKSDSPVLNDGVYAPAPGVASFMTIDNGTRSITPLVIISLYLFGFYGLCLEGGRKPGEQECHSI